MNKARLEKLVIERVKVYLMISPSSDHEIIVWKAINKIRPEWPVPKKKQLTKMIALTFKANEGGRV